MKNFYKLTELFGRSWDCFHNIVSFHLDLNQENIDVSKHLKEIKFIAESSLRIVDQEFSDKYKEDFTLFLNLFLEHYNDVLVNTEVEEDSLIHRHYSLILCDFLNLMIYHYPEEKLKISVEDMDSYADIKKDIHLYANQTRDYTYPSKTLELENIYKVVNLCTFIEETIKSGLNMTTLVHACIALANELGEFEYLELVPDKYMSPFLDTLSFLTTETEYAYMLDKPLSIKIRKLEFLCKSVRFLLQDYNCRRSAFYSLNGKNIYGNLYGKNK